MTSPEIEKHPMYACPGCGVVLSKEEEPSYGFPSVYNKRGKRVVHLTQCCSRCQDVEIAMKEAQDESRRFTPVGTGTDDDYFYHGRCVCGATTHGRLLMCISCWKRTRMLNKADAENRMLSKVLKELRATIRDKKKRETEEQTTT
jgi:hypothetical protein